MINFKSTFSILLLSLLILCFNYEAIGQNVNLDFNEETGVLTADAFSNSGPYYFTWSQNYQILFEEETGRYSAILIKEAGEYCIVVRKSEGCEAQGCFIYDHR